MLWPLFWPLLGLLLPRHTKNSKSASVLDVWNIENAYLVWTSLGVHLGSTILPCRHVLYTVIAPWKDGT
jgi:hypothetical protein